jgi:hypothetical protein
MRYHGWNYMHQFLLWNISFDKIKRILIDNTIRLNSEQLKPENFFLHTTMAWIFFCVKLDSFIILKYINKCP